MNDLHQCSEGRRFDRLEQSLEAIQKTLATLTDLLISKATTDVRVQNLETNVNKIMTDYEPRIRASENKLLKNEWVERLAWVFLTSCILAYYKL